jgi:hypothetical protein
MIPYDDIYWMKEKIKKGLVNERELEAFSLGMIKQYFETREFIVGDILLPHSTNYSCPCEQCIKIRGKFKIEAIPDWETRIKADNELKEIK